MRVRCWRVKVRGSETLRVGVPVARTWSVVSIAVLAGLLVLALALTTTDVKGISPRPAEAAGVNVSVAYKATPEKTRVENNTNHRITVKKVGSIRSTSPAPTSRSGSTSGSSAASR